MEREIWSVVLTALRRLGDRRPLRCQFTDCEILEVYLWAALHDRPISWACRRESWPLHSRRRLRPNPSTMTRRLRTMSLKKRMLRLRRALQKTGSGRRVFIDGKPLIVSAFSKDRQATWGYAVNNHARGYKLHAICDDCQSIVNWSVRPMNEAESVVGRRLVSRCKTNASLLYADASYDSNPLHAVAARRGMQLLAPRRKPGRGLGWRTHHPGRLRSIEILEHDPVAAKEHRRARVKIERCFGNLTSFGGGLSPLPAWVRTLHRVRLWVLAKLIFNAARITIRSQ